MNRLVRRKSRSIVAKVRAGLLVYVIGCLGTLAAIVLFVSFTVYVEQLRSLQHERARAAALEIDAYVEDLVRKMGFLARVRGLTEFPLEHRRALLEGLLRHNTAYQTVTLVDASGAVTSTLSQHDDAGGSPPNAEEMGVSAAFRRGMAGEDFVGPVELDPRLQRPVLSLAVPVRDRSDRIAGVLLATIDLEFLGFVVSEVTVGKTGYAYVFDNRGFVIADERDSTSTLRPLDPGIRRDLAKSQLPLTYRGIDGRSVVGAVAPVHSAHFHVVVELPTDEAFATLRRTIIAIACALGLAMAFALAMGMWFSRQVIAPVEVLADAALQVQRGDLDTVARVPAQSELGFLATAFNEMTARLRALIRNMVKAIADRDRLLEAEQAARARAEAAEQRAAFLASASAELAASLDVEDVLHRVAQLAVPAVAEWCVIDVVDGTALRRAASAHAVPERAPLLDELEQPLPPTDPAARVVESGRPLLLASVEDMLTPEQSPEHAQLLRSLGTRGAIVLPLAARGRTLGVITFAIGSEQAHRYELADLACTEELARRASLALDNAQLHEQTQEAVRARDLFLSIASHELRSPISAMRLRLQTATRASPGSPVPPEKLTSTIAFTEQQTRRLADLVSTLLDVSRITAGKLELEPEELDLCDVVREVTARLEPEATRASSPITLALPDAAKGRWDRLRMEQVVSNLVNNAIRYGRGKPIHVEVAHRHGGVTLCVRDEGAGIAPADRTRIFDRFQRAVTDRSGGLGLGLYIVRQIVLAHGGTVSVESEVGHGSKFTVDLPCAHSHVEAA